MIELLRALILGIVEGFTEFLPISSTGHLIVVEKFLGFKDINDLFTVVIQLGAIAAVIWYYRQDLWSRIVGLFKRETAAIRFWTVIIVGCIPAALFGLFLDKHMNSITVPAVVATTLIIGGVIMWLVDRKPVHKHDDPVELGDISTKQAALIGLGQAVAIIPGVSRSGATIVSGLMTGLNRPTATAFSFYLAVPIMIAATGYKMLKYRADIAHLPGGLPALGVGVLASFIVALLAISWLLKYIASNNFKMFAYYRIAAGLVIFALLGLHWL